MLVFIVIPKVQKMLKIVSRVWGFLVVLSFHLKINRQVFSNFCQEKFPHRASSLAIKTQIWQQNISRYFFRSLKAV